MAFQGPLNAGSQKEVILGSFTTTQRDALTSVSAGSLIYNSTTSQLQIYSNGAWAAVYEPPIDATGGTIDTSTFAPDNYKVHVFTSPGSLIVTSGTTTNATILLVGGGGGGGGSYGGGGGAGAYLVLSNVTIEPGTYPVTRGAGGAAGSGGGSPYYPPSPGAYQPGYAIGLIGGTTNFGSGTPLNTDAPGGGGGGVRATAGGPSPGGSGGGGGDGYPTGSLPGGTSGAYGNPGGQGKVGNGAPYGGGGGGGAGAAGSPEAAGRMGGVGSNSFTYVPPSYGTPGPNPGRYFAGGGGGGAYSAASPVAGGAGGGGAGGPGGPPDAFKNGVANTGGGGGGGPDNGPLAGGAGGSGIVIIAYPTA
jgi:hypothetical protein